MTGPEHYKEAERLLSQPIDAYNDEEWDRARARRVAEANVHATLALAAATSLVGVRDPDRWLEVAG